MKSVVSAPIYMYMKRFIPVLLSAVILLSSCITAGAVYAPTVSAGTTEDILTAVYANSYYEISLRNAVYAEGGEDDGKMLTDTKYSKPFGREGEPIEGWVKIESYDGECDFSVTVDIDLGFAAKGLNTFYSRNNQCTEKSIGFPYSVKFYISENGSDYSYIGEGITDTDTSLPDTTAIYRLITEENHTARYVRTVFDCEGSSILYINEICAAAMGKIFYTGHLENGITKDSQGLIYRIEGNAAEVIGYDSGSTENPGSISPCTASFNEDGITYTLGKGSHNEVEVITDFIETDQTNYSGAPNLIKYIVIHNTGTTGESTDADRYNERLHESDGTSSWHYTVDNSVIYHSLPDHIAGWHAGPSHNYESIGIEMCVNNAPTDYEGIPVFEGEEYEAWVENQFRKTMKNTATLVAELLTRYGLSTDAVIQHYDVSEKDCPQWLRTEGQESIYDGKLWLEFMGYVEEYYYLLNGDSAAPKITPDGNIVIPDYITVRGEVYPVTSIGSEAFIGKEQDIRRIEIGNMTDSIPYGCFDGIEGLEEISIPEENVNFYVNDGILFDAEGNIIFDLEADSSVIPQPKDNCILDIRESDGRYYLYLGDEGYFIEAIAVEYGKVITQAVDANGKPLVNDDVPATGAVITFEDGARLYVASRGDADGDGEIGSMDYILTKRMFYETYLPTRSQIMAVSVTNGESVTSMDYILLKRHFFNTYDIMK